MGAKSSNVVAEREMLPLFRVLSDLEKPALVTSSLSENNERIDSLLCSNTECNLSFCEFCADDGKELSHFRVTSSDTSNVVLTKKRRRLKRHETLSSCSERQKMPVKERPGSARKKSSKEVDVNPMIHSISDDPSLPDVKKRLGMFTNMSLNMYRNKNVDLSRHFKDAKHNNDEVEIDRFQSDSECPIYETPNDVLARSDDGNERVKRKKKAGKKSKHVNHSTETVKNGQKISKKVMLKRYESMLSVLIEKCEQKESMILDYNTSMSKIKKKLKEALQYNEQFAQENEYLKNQHDDMKNCIEQYKNFVSTLEDQQKKNLEQSISDPANEPACARCSIIELSAIKIEKENMKLNEDIVMLKNVVFRLNVQLSRYQERLRLASKHPEVNIGGNETNPEVTMPSLPTFTNGGENPSEASTEENVKNCSKYDGFHNWGDVNTHVLAPLLNAYQESLTEKDHLIKDYEKEFNRFTSKLKEIILENDNLHGDQQKLSDELKSSRETSGLAITERDNLRRENYEIKEKLVEVNEKLKTLQESYEQKVQSMSRDYTLIHQEYFKTKTGLAVVQGRCQALEDQQKTKQEGNSMPTRVHVEKIEECKKMFDELKNRYEIDKSKYTTRISILEENVTLLEKKHLNVNNEKQKVELKLKAFSKSLRKHQHAVSHYRKELTALKSSRDIFKQRAARATALCRKLAHMLNEAAGDDKLQHLKTETMTVRKEAMKELETLEVRLSEQNVNFLKAQEENESELLKYKELLREKDAKIEAMRQHMRGDRLPRYIGHSSSGYNHDWKRAEN